MGEERGQKLDLDDLIFADVDTGDSER